MKVDEISEFSDCFLRSLRKEQEFVFVFTCFIVAHISDLGVDKLTILPVTLCVDEVSGGIFSTDD